MPRKIPQDVQNKLLDKNWLLDMHVQQLFSIVAISKILHVVPAVVRKAIRFHGIQTPSQQDLREATNKRKYGVTNPGAVKEFRDKALSTMEKKFGGHNWSKNNRQQRDETCLKKYGATNVGGTDYSKQKARETNIEKYGRLHKNQTHLYSEVLDKLSNREWLVEQHINQKKTLLQIASELGLCEGSLTNSGALTKALRQHNIELQRFSVSFEENQIADYIESLGIKNIKRSCRDVIPPLELDIFVSDLNIAIEYCGLYWHGESRGKYRTYHQTKTNKCKKLGIRLITIYDSEWKYKQEIVKNKLRSLFNKINTPLIHARKCLIREITTEEKQNFFEEYHIQGDGPSSINYGLLYDNEIVGAIGFIKKFNNVFVLNRFATSNRIPGGFSKLLFYFQKNNNWSKIITFADLRWSVGSLYEKTGFVLEKTLPPDYSYIVEHKPQHKFAFRRKYLKNKLQKFDPNLSEWENCKANNIDRIWDCGKKRYVLTNALLIV
jgi:predicted DsbA family dithiol-disulfide isomerase